MRLFRATLVALGLLLPALAYAQTTGSIAGAVRDTSGAVMPGVTVEVSSPALIEKVRTAITDGQGLFSITNLPPGTYSATFTLPGFSPVKREGIALTSNFTATVNAELRVGALEETITVSGAAPTVDTRTVATQKVFTREVLDAVPTATGFAGRAQLIPGMVYGTGTTVDVGGDKAESLGSVTFHGGHLGDFQPFVDGMSVTNGIAKHSFGYNPNNGAMQEVVLEVGSQDAEHEFSGVVSNLVPRDGSNTFRGQFVGSNTTTSWQTNNLSQDLINRGLKAVNRVKHFWDFNPSGGGPLMRDKLWFYTSFRYWGINQYAANTFYNTDIRSVFPSCTGAPVPGCRQPGAQAVTLTYHYSVPLRIAYQATPKNKFTLWGEHQYTDAVSLSATSSPEASLPQHYNPQYLVEGTWSAPVTNRLLVQAAFAAAVNDPYRYHLSHEDALGNQPTVPNDVSSIVELSTGYTYRANPSLNIGSGYGRYWSTNWTYKGSAAYITGSHNMKFGFQMSRMTGDLNEFVNNSLNYQFRNGAPAVLQMFTTDADGIDYLMHGMDWGVFAQDQWVIKKLTLNLGVRTDNAHFQTDPEHENAGRFAPARDYPGVDNVPNFHDVSPRLGASYDVFGNGKTAVKATIGKYVEAVSNGTFGVAANPLSTTVLSVTRTWTDPNFPNDLVNGDVFPDCDLTNPLANTSKTGQVCGQISDLNFGNTAKVTTKLDPSATTGWGTRGYNWETSVGVQHELFSGTSVNVGYYRRWFGNQRVTQNTALSNSDFSPYCITAPADSRLPGGGGNQICGFYDENPVPFATVINTPAIKSVNSFGKVDEVYDGIDVTVNARLPRGIMAAGGMNTGRTKFNYCYSNSLPTVTDNVVLGSGIAFGPANTTAAGATAPRTAGGFCDINPPFLAQYKGFVVYPWPVWGIRSSATFQSLPGNPIYAGVVYSSAQIAPSLGRNLSAGAAGTAILDVLPPGALYLPRLYQVDLRSTKIFKVGGRTNITVNFDLYNLFNGNYVLSINDRYGANWQQPTAIMAGRLAKAGVQVDF